MRIKKILFPIVFLLFPAIFLAQDISQDPRLISAISIIEAWMDAEVAYKDIPGISAGIVYDQELVWSRGFGFSDIDTKKPATPESMYSICSISKLFTSISVLQLRDEGKISLDDPIKKYLPWFNIKDTFPDAPEITLRGILTHSSGLPRESDFPYWTGPDYRFPTSQEMIKKLSQQEELYPAFTYFQYSNLGLTLAGEIVSAVSGQPYDQYVKENILRPLGLSHTLPEIPRNERGRNLASPYTSKLRNGSRQLINFYHVKGIAPAAGFVSTVVDLAKFASWQFRLLQKGEKEILPSNTLREMHRVHWIDPDWETTWGLGFSVSHRNGKIFVGHGGSCPGYRTSLSMCPKENIAVIVMINCSDGNTGSISRIIFDLAAGPILDIVKNPGKFKETDPALLKYLGRYDRTLDGPLGREVHFFVKDGQLVMIPMPTDNPIRAMTKLKHIEGHRFKRIRDDGELGEDIVFEAGPDGKITRVIHNSNIAIKMN